MMAIYSSITVQSVLFHTRPETIERTLASIDRVAQLGQSGGEHGLVDVALGDCSPSPTLRTDEVEALGARFPGIRALRYRHFDTNLGHGGAQNLLARDTATDLVVMSNPDVLPSRRALGALAALLDDPTVGIAEAKQLPLEHPKEYDRVSGATSWASGAFSMMRTAEFVSIGGFDENSFFLYGDDVDLSWRYRLRGMRVLFQPAAAVFHDKRLGVGGEWLASETERFYSVESALLLAYKWSRDDVLDPLLAALAVSEVAIEQRALAAFEARRAAGRLPERLDPSGTTGEFVAGNYAVHRW